MYRHRQPASCRVLEPARRALYRGGGGPGAGDGEPDDIRRVGEALRSLRVRGQSPGNAGPTHGAGDAAGA
ncbi:hypothetical protein FKM82_030358, partial [Ascaphus truei]